jgi:hypothetical protein
VYVLDEAGWHTSYLVAVPEHLHLLFLPAHVWELQPCEHLWPFTDVPQVNWRCRDMDELEHAQSARCAVLQERRPLIPLATLSSWWPKRITKRHGYSQRGYDS